MRFFSVACFKPSCYFFVLLASPLTYITNTAIVLSAVLINIVMCYWSGIADWTNLSFHIVFTLFFAKSIVEHQKTAYFINIFILEGRLLWH